jgi:hypothetical protein
MERKNNTKFRGDYLIVDELGSNTKLAMTIKLSVVRTKAKRL